MKDRFLSQEDRERLEQAFDKNAGQLGHRPQSIGDGIFDQLQCSCGWLGDSFWDGADLARAQWVRHVEAASADGQLVFNFL